jgi:hypothetical protein
MTAEERTAADAERYRRQQERRATGKVAMPCFGGRRFVITLQNGSIYEARHAELVRAGPWWVHVENHEERLKFKADWVESVFLD